jgi:hypothetical protein
MNDDFSDLEAELERMRPCAPSSELQARLAATLDQPATSSASPVGTHRSAFSWRTWKWVLGSTAVAAAMLLALVITRLPDPVGPTAGQTAHPANGTVAGPFPVTPASPDLYKPVSVENVLYDSHDEGLVTLDDGAAARRVFQRYLDTYTWRNPRTNASLRWTVPRDEVRVIPVRAY